MARSLGLHRASLLREIADECTVGSKFGLYCNSWSRWHPCPRSSEKARLSDKGRPGKGRTMLATHFVS
jgi:hypothetical protein